MSQLIESVARDQWITTRYRHTDPPPTNNLYVESIGERPEHLRQGAQERIDLYLAAQTELDNADLHSTVHLTGPDKMIEKITRAEWIVYEWSAGACGAHGDPLPGMVYARGKKRHPMESIRAAAQWEYYQAVITDAAWQREEWAMQYPQTLVDTPPPPLYARTVS